MTIKHEEGELLRDSLISYRLSHPHSEDHDYISEHVAREHVAWEKEYVPPNSYIYAPGGFATSANLEILSTSPAKEKTLIHQQQSPLNLVAPCSLPRSKSQS